MINRILHVISSLVFVGFGLMGLYMGLFTGGIDWLPAIVGTIFAGAGITLLVKGNSLSGGPMTGDELENFTSLDDDVVNPATGLPMSGGIGGLDSMGNAFGFDDD